MLYNIIRLLYDLRVVPTNLSNQDQNRLADRLRVFVQRQLSYYAQLRQAAHYDNLAAAGNERHVDGAVSARRQTARARAPEVQHLGPGGARN